MKRFTRKPNRLKDYDYSKNGCYFITICSKDRKEIFAEYNQNIVGTGLAPVRYLKLSVIGEIIEKQWIDLSKKYHNVEVDNYIIMPNHIHGILIIDDKKMNIREGASPSPTLSDIIRVFKSRCSIEYLDYIRQNGLNVSGQIWQRSFYDHIIRTEDSLKEIREYISNNPNTWNMDENNINSVQNKY